MALPLQISLVFHLKGGGRGKNTLFSLCCAQQMYFFRLSGLHKDPWHPVLKGLVGFLLAASDFSILPWYILSFGRAASVFTNLPWYLITRQTITSFSECHEVYRKICMKYKLITQRNIKIQLEQGCQRHPARHFWKTRKTCERHGHAKRQVKKKRRHNGHNNFHSLCN